MELAVQSPDRAAAAHLLCPGHPERTSHHTGEPTNRHRKKSPVRDQNTHFKLANQREHQGERTVEIPAPVGALRIGDVETECRGQAVAAGTEEMSASIREIARNTAEAARVAADAPEPLPAAWSRGTAGATPELRAEGARAVIAAADAVVIATRPDSPIRSLGELIVQARAAPGKISFGTTGAGASQHMLPEWFSAETGIEMLQDRQRDDLVAIS